MTNKNSTKAWIHVRIENTKVPMSPTRKRSNRPSTRNRRGKLARRPTPVTLPSSPRASQNRPSPAAGAKLMHEGTPASEEHTGRPRAAVDKRVSGDRIRSNERGSNLSFLQGLYIDLLGSLIPGLLAVILGCAALLLAFSAVYRTTFHDLSRDEPAPASTTATSSNQQPLQNAGESKDNGSSEGILSIVSSFHWEIGTVILVSSFVVGGIFFRRDPKNPDARSALYIWRHSSLDECDGLAVRFPDTWHPLSRKLPTPTWLYRRIHQARSMLYSLWHCSPWKRRELMRIAQFPYDYMRCYLSARHLHHLARFVPWCPGGTADAKNYVCRRTKMLINIIKTRLLSLYPDSSRDLIRNEAHVRLATSVWYAASALRNLSIAVIGILAVILCRLSDPTAVRAAGSTLFLAFSFAGLLLVFSLVIHHYLKRCLHYMRVREVVYVLEAASIAHNASGGRAFSDLIPQDQISIDCEHCPRKKPVAGAATS